ncbi:MAG: DUF86 domain-containing protein [Planctomycetes bacterium]|nr:DUF86 domain-containing protein [Planctomycetota bacterium]
MRSDQRWGAIGHSKVQVISCRSHILNHDYMGVDLNAVWQIIENELPALKENVLKNL